MHNSKATCQHKEEGEIPDTSSMRAISASQSCSFSFNNLVYPQWPFVETSCVDNKGIATGFTKHKDIFSVNPDMTYSCW